MTTVRLSRFPEPPQVYGGIRKNIHLWRKTIKSHSPIGTFLIPFLLVDSPFSLATDTAFLPVTIPTELFLLGQQKKVKNRAQIVPERHPEPLSGDPGSQRVAPNHVAVVHEDLHVEQRPIEH